MKPILSLKKLIAVLLLGSATASFAVTATQTYEFQWQTSDPTFQPTYLWITTALNVVSSASTSVLNFQITTPDGVWTPSTLTGTGATSSTPYWYSGTLEVINGGSTLVVQGMDILHATSAGPQASSVASGYYSVGFSTTNIIDTTYTANTVSSIANSAGAWVAVPQSVTVPETSGTLPLLAFACAALGLLYYRQVRPQNS